MFHEQIQEPASRSTTMRAFVFLAKFIIAKYLKQEVNDNLSICLDECSPCGLSVTWDIKIFQYYMITWKWCYYPQWWDALRSYFYCLNLITVALPDLPKSHWTWGNDISTSWGRVPIGKFWMRFTCCPNLLLQLLI